MIHFLITLIRTAPAGYELTNALRKVLQKIGGFPAFAGEESNQEPAVLNPVNILEKLLNDFAIVKKNEFKGISAYLCPDCLSLQLIYIKDLGKEWTAREKHTCQKERLAACGLIQERAAKYMDLFKKENDYLIELTNWMFPEKYLVVQQISGIPVDKTFHAVWMQFNLISPTDWVWRPIVNRGVALTDSDVDAFVQGTQATYAIVLVSSGRYAGQYYMYVTNSPTC